MRRPSFSRLAAGLLTGALALGAGYWPDAATAPPQAAGQGILTMTASMPARLRLGPAPPLPAGSRRVITGKIVGLEPPVQGPVSIEAWMLAGEGKPDVFIGRFSPFPLARIEPAAPRRHQPFLLPLDGVVPAQGGGNWTIEFRLATDPAATPGSMQIQLGAVAFGVD